MPRITPLTGRHPSWWKLVLGGGLLIAGYFALNPLISKNAMVLILLPLYYFASVYGRWGGMAAATLALPFNLTMFHFMGGPELLLTVGLPFWVSSFALIPLFYEIGYSRELRWRLARELEHSYSLAEQLREERDRVQQTSESKDALLMSISHDLRTPVSAIIQSAELIEAAPHTAAERADLIRRTGHRLLEVVNDLLQGYRKLQHQRPERPAPFDLRRLLDEIVRLHRPLFDTRHLQLDLQIAPDLPSWFEGHAAQVHRILANLLGNSLKHTESGGVLIRAAALAPTHGPPRLEIAVIDSGRGIPAHQIGPLLAAARTTPALTEAAEGPGYGLGLGNCLRLCDRIGAELLLLPNSPQGLQALLRLPWRPGEPAGERSDEIAATPPPGNCPHSLVVDDEAAGAPVLAAMLQQLGCEVTTAADGAAALRRLDGATFQLAFLDLQLPDIDGRQLAAELRRRTPSTFLILFSANILLTDVDLWLSLDVDLILSKPISLHELRQLLAQGDAGRPAAPQIPRQPSGPENEITERHRRLLLEYLEQCLFAYGRQDLAACAAQAHKLAGAAGTLRQTELAECAMQVEQAARGGQRIPLFPPLRRLAAATLPIVHPATPPQA